MAYDETLASRVRDLAPDLSEKKMFGGLALLRDGNMAVGVYGDGLIVRVSRDEHEAMLAEPGVRPFEMGGRTMAGWLLVGREVLDDDALRAWVSRGVTYAASLPPK
jgi:TfoX/Sxy family transcriptional regulator of competence genes